MVQQPSSLPPMLDYNFDVGAQCARVLNALGITPLDAQEIAFLLWANKFLTYPLSDNTLDYIVVRKNSIAIGQRKDNGLFCLPGGYAEHGQQGLKTISENRRRNDLHLVLGAMEVLQEIGLAVTPCVYGGEFSEAPRLADGKILLFGREPKQPIIPTLVIVGVAGSGEIKPNPKELISAEFMELFERDDFGRLYPHSRLASLHFNADHWRMILRFLHLCRQEMLPAETVESMLRRIAYISNTVTDEEVNFVAVEEAKPGSTFFLDALADFLRGTIQFSQYGISAEIAAAKLAEAGVVPRFGKFGRTVDLICVTGNNVKLQTTLNGKSRTRKALIGTFLHTGRCTIDPTLYGYPLTTVDLMQWVQPESVRDAVRRVLAVKAGLVPDYIFNDIFYAACGYDRDPRIPTFTNVYVVVPSHGMRVHAAAPEAIVDMPIFAGEPWSLDSVGNILLHPELLQLDFDHSEMMKAFAMTLKKIRPKSHFNVVTVEMALEAQSV